MSLSVQQLENILKDNLIKRTKSNADPQRMLERHFRQLDLDSNGLLSFDEFHRAIEPFVIGAPNATIQSLFEKWDLDGNGTLDAQEFIHGLFQSTEERQQRTQTKIQETERKRETSIKSNDILAQAVNRRQARESQQQEENVATIVKRGQVETENVTNKMSLLRTTSRKLEEHDAADTENAKMMQGPFTVRDWNGTTPNVVRYKVSNSWIAVSPPVDCNLDVEIRRSAEAPREQLQLEFAYSINHAAGVHTTKNGEVVYAIAGLGVVYSPETHSQRFFSGHEDDITCIAVDPSHTYAATGSMGRAPVIHVWNLKTMELVSSTKAGFYERLVSALSFSAKNPKLLVGIGGDNHHLMGLWDWTTGTLLAEAPTQNGTPPQVTSIVFDDENTNKDIDRFVTLGFKHIKFWTWDGKRLNGGKNAKYGKVTQQPRDMKCAVFLKNDTALSGGSNGVLYVWDIATTECKRAIPAHNGPLLAMLAGDGDSLLTSGGKTGEICFWNAANAAVGNRLIEKKATIEMPSGPVAGMAFLARGRAPPIVVVATARNELWAYTTEKQWKLLIGGHYGDLYGLACHPCNAVAFATVGEDKQVCIWDAKTRQRIQVINLENQARSVAINHDGSLLAVGCKDGSFSVLKPGTGTIVFSAKHCQEMIDDLAFSPDGTLLAVGSHDNFVDVYASSNFQHVRRLKGHSSYVTHLDWSNDSKFIQSTSGAYDLLVWEVSTGKRVTRSQILRNIEWYTLTCVLGFDVMGIWREGFDGTDINASARSPDHRLLCFGDDSGMVHLLNFPCIVKSAPSQIGRGHSSHVMNVRWLSDGKRVISVGGHDRAVFQWQLTSPVAVATTSTFGSKTFNAQQSDLIGATKPWKVTSAWK